MPPRTLTAGAAARGDVVGPVECVAPEFVGVGVWVCPLVVDGVAVAVAWPSGLAESLNGASPAPAGPFTSAVVRTSVNGSLTRLAAPKPTLTEATAKTAQRTTSVNLLGTANLPDLVEPDRLSLGHRGLTGG
jgi:hypothetical protein